MTDDLMLVVEGPDDLHVMGAILKHHGFTPKFTIQDEGGIETLLDRLPIRLQFERWQRLGIVVDADLDIAARWDKLKRIFMGVGYAGLPENPDPSGTVVLHANLPRVGMWLMPDNVLPGMLEDYVALLVPQDDNLWGRARHCLDDVPLAERRFSERHHSKALIHTWLAWQDDPGTPLGQAITKKYLDPASPHVTKFLAWLTRVFA
jgi:hypothetical protein